MRRTARLIAASALLAAGVPLAASAPMPSLAGPLELDASRALAEARAAEAEVERLEQAARKAQGEAERLRTSQAAAAEAIAAAEARITAADANLRLITARITARRERLAHEQAPAGALLAALAMMAERPPLLAVLDRGSTEEFVRVRLLLDSTLPAIRARTASLRAELEQGRQLQRSAELARLDMVASRNALAQRRREFARLEAQALRAAELRGSEAIGAGDVALARGEEAAELAGEGRRRRAAIAIAAELAAMSPPPPRPGASESGPPRAPFAYTLPAAAPVVEGLGTVAPNGVRSRGLTLASRRGAPIAAPATGTVRFSGPFRSYDGIVIIDHGGGWMSLILNISSPLRPGERVRIGQPLGRALGRLGVELSRNGNHMSPALIAGSSQMLSNRDKRG